jgi:succinate dehydrogenase hydrophobic membrane anchor protein
MDTDSVKTGVEAPDLSKFRCFPIISAYAQSRGWYFIISWCHRITGVALVSVVWIRILSLESLLEGGAYNSKKESFPISFLLWLLAIPLTFHALNGGRLILYECFGKRNDESMMRWVAALSIAYLAILALLMAVGDQRVSLFFYWLIVLVVALLLGYGVAAKIWETGHSIFWKVQRISGAFLLVMVPAYILFLYLDLPPDTTGSPIIPSMATRFVFVVYVLLLVAALYHGAYGLWSVVSDYISSGVILACSIVLITLVTLALAWSGIRLTLTLW